MNRSVKIALLTVPFVGLAAAGGFASQRAENDALAGAAANVSFTQAIAAAEQHAAGKAVRGEFEHSKKGTFYEIEVVNGAKVFDVKVDAGTGSVISSKEDKHDGVDDDDDH